MVTKILLIEDIENLRLLMIARLENQGFKVDVAEDIKTTMYKTRELKNLVKSIIPFKTTDTIQLDDLSCTIIGEKSLVKDKRVSLAEFEVDYVLKDLKITDFNVTRATEILGITRARLYRKISHLDLKDPEVSASI